MIQHSHFLSCTNFYFCSCFHFSMLQKSTRKYWSVVEQTEQIKLFVWTAFFLHPEDSIQIATESILKMTSTRDYTEEKIPSISVFLLQQSHVCVSLNSITSYNSYYRSQKRKRTKHLKLKCSHRSTFTQIYIRFILSFGKRRQGKSVSSIFEPKIDLKY